MVKNMDFFIPDIYQKSIYTIDYKALKKNGIKCIIFDLNNTIAPLSTEVPDKKMKDLFAYLETLKLKIIIVSNAKKERVEPFKEKLNVDSAFQSKKPSLKKYQKILRLYHLEVHEVASIGDELTTDIYASNKMGFKSILVNSISQKGNKHKMIEKIIWKKLQKKGILEKGTYYA